MVQTLKISIKGVLASSKKEIAGTIEKMEKPDMENVYCNGSIYDLAYHGSDGDKQFYISKAQTGKILYLGVGTGRIFCELYKKNKNCIGIDNAPEMMKILKEKMPNISKDSLLISDIREIDFAYGKFDVVIAPFSFFTHFSPQETVVLFNKIKKWVKKEGKFYTDFFAPKVPSGGYEIITSSNKKKVETLIVYNSIEQSLIELTKITSHGKASKLHRLNLFYYFPHQIELLAKQAGWNTYKISGGFKNQKITERSNVYILEASML